MPAHSSGNPNLRFHSQTFNPSGLQELVQITEGSPEQEWWEARGYFGSSEPKPWRLFSCYLLRSKSNLKQCFFSLCTCRKHWLSIPLFWDLVWLGSGSAGQKMMPIPLQLKCCSLRFRGVRMTHGKVKTAAPVQQEGEDLLRESVWVLIKQERENRQKGTILFCQNENC